MALRQVAAWRRWSKMSQSAQHTKGRVKMDALTNAGAVTRRRFLLASGAAAGSALLARDMPVAWAARRETGQVSLAFWKQGVTPRLCAAFHGLAAAYKHDHPTVTVTTECLGGSMSFQGFRQMVLARIAAGNPPDTIVIQDTPVSWAARSALDPVDDLMQSSAHSRRANWPAAVLTSCQYQGRTYGLPITAASICIWYNQELLEKRGIPARRQDFPTTWDELRRLSKEFTHWKGDVLEQAGFMPWAGLPFVFSLDVWSALNGGQLYDATRQRYTIDAESNVAMMEYFVSWLNDEYRGDIRAVRRVYSWAAYPDLQNRPPAFQEGRLMAMMSGSYIMGDVYSYVKPGAHLQWNVASNPVGPRGKRTVSGTRPNWAVIPRGSPHRSDAFGWLDYLGSTGMRAWFDATPDLPVNKSVPHDLASAIVVQKRGKPFALDVTRFLIGQLDIAIPMWTSPVDALARDQIQRATERILNKVATPKEALAEAQRASQNALETVLRP